MPVMDGLTCTQKIREMQKSGKIRGYVPIIAVTANARSEQIATAKDSGMVSRLTCFFCFFLKKKFTFGKWRNSLI